MSNQQKVKRSTMAVICFILTMAITIQLRTMSKQDSSVSQVFQNDGLKDTLLQWQEKYSDITKELEKSLKELEAKRTIATQNDEKAKEKNDQVTKNNMLLGLTDVTGQGIILTAADGQTPKETDNISEYLVHDADLREIVSELSNAGAEAISINDQRIVNTTCINCVGNVISINGEKVSSPFVIKAIGNQESLYGINRPGGYIQYMKDATQIDLKKSNNITIKKFDGALKFKYSTTVK